MACSLAISMFTMVCDDAREVYPGSWVRSLTYTEVGQYNGVRTSRLYFPQLSDGRLRRETIQAGRLYIANIKKQVSTFRFKYFLITRPENPHKISDNTTSQL
jgi:hypothetical protein